MKELKPSCPVCKNDDTNIFTHLLENIDDHAHKKFIFELSMFIMKKLRHHHSFAVSDHILEHFPDLIGVDMNQLTNFVALQIELFGFSIRKRADLERKEQDSVRPLSDTQLEAILTKVARPNTPLFNNTCIYCGEHLIISDKDYDNRNDNRYRTDNTLIQISENKNIGPVLSDVAQLCDDCLHNYTRSPYISITRIFTFAAAHHLPFHKGLCQYTHGHEWKLEVAVKCKRVLGTGMVMDFSDLKKFVNKSVIDILDHNYVNDLIYNPTAENICYWVWDTLSLAGLKGIHKIKVWEAPNSIAEITLEDVAHKLEVEAN